MLSQAKFYATFLSFLLCCAAANLLGQNPDGGPPPNPGALTHLSSLSCGPEQIAKWDGAAWVCDSRVTDNGSAIDVLDSRVTINEGDITALETDVTDNGSAIDVLEGSVTTNEGDITALETGVADLEDRQVNPMQVALLRWYEASEAGNDFAVGRQPVGMAFDGANIWVSNSLDNTVSKLRASDGVVLGTFPVGVTPVGMAFDGANIWVANLNDDSVSKLRDGVVLDTFTVGVGNGPVRVAFDGANIWVVNFFDISVSKLRASDGMPLGTFTVSRAGHVAFDGANIWVTTLGTPGALSKLRASDGMLLGTFAVGNGPQGIAFDGANIWVTNFRSDTVSKR